MIEINKIYNESCLDTIVKMPDNFLDCVITSPPYWQLRDYGYDGQCGLEPTYQEYLGHLWSLMDAIYPKLKKTGTVWINLGDTYSTRSGINMALSKGVDVNSYGSIINNRARSGKLLKDKNLPNKCLLLLPHRFAIGCQERKWVVRNDIVWGKRNGLPEPVTDRFTKKHEYVFFMVKNEKYYFNLDVVRNNVDIESVKRKLRGKHSAKYGDYHPNLSKEKDYEGYDNLDEELDKTKGANPGDVSDFWDIPTRGNGMNHYATYNEYLITIPMLAGCPEGGIIYDPFMGSGTTAICALRANRKFIGSEMSEEYCEIVENRLKASLLQLKFF